MDSVGSGRGEGGDGELEVVGVDEFDGGDEGAEEDGGVGVEVFAEDGDGGADALFACVGGEGGDGGDNIVFGGRNPSSAFGGGGLELHLVDGTQCKNLLCVCYGLG